MKTYKTTGIVSLFSGLIGLSDDQARKRLHNLEKVSDEIYRINKMVQFKAGELIRLETMPKVYSDVLHDQDAVEENQDVLIDFEAMTMPKLKEHLESIGVDYPKRANKAELIELCSQKT